MEKVLKEKTPRAYLNENGQWCVIRRAKGNFPKTVDTYIEIPPYAVDAETGEFLNKSAVPILKKGEPFNFYEKIQSYKGECDIYQILTKFSITGDTSLINKKQVSFGDVFDVPDNINDFTQLTEKQQQQLKAFTPIIQRTILEGKSDEINKLVEDLVKEKLVKMGYVKQESEVKKDE